MVREGFQVKTHSLATALLAAGFGLAATSVAGRAEDVIKIGVVAAESGSFVSAGNTIPAAARLAAKEINDAGGVTVGGKTYKIQLEIRDDRTNIDTAIAAARELVDDVGVKAIFGTESHDFSIAMAKITGPAKVLQFTGNSSLGSGLTDASVAPGGPDHYVFQTEPQEFQRSGSTAKGVLSLLTPLLPHPPKTSVVFVANDLAGQYLSSHYVKALEADGQKTSLVYYPPDTNDFTPLLTRIKGMHPDIVHLWYNGDETLIAYPQAVQLNVAPAYFLFGVDPGVWRARKLTSSAPITLSCVPVCWGAPPTKKVADYFDRYFAMGAVKGVQSSVSLLYYDYLHWYAKALEAVGTLDNPDAVVDWMLKSKYDGVVSAVPLTFNAHHQVTFATEVCLVKPNTSDQFKCAVEQPPAAPPPGDPGG